MYILCGLAGEIASVMGTLAINQRSRVDVILEISKNGYKVDKKILENIPNNFLEKRQQEVTKIKKICNAILLFCPGLNLAYAGLEHKKFIKEVMESPEIKDSIVPMTDNEKEQYSHLKLRNDKLAFSFYIMSNDLIDKEFVGYVNKTLYILDKGTALYNDYKISPLAYSLEEVKRLNRVTNLNYKIGKLEGKNVAIIGIPKPNTKLNNIRLINGCCQSVSSFIPMNDAEAENKTFIVYPYNIEFYDKVEKEVEGIIESRNKNSLKESKVEYFEPIINKQKDMVLKRTLHI